MKRDKRLRFQNIVTGFRNKHSIEPSLLPESNC
jgi:hypothetical protein